ncbi:GPP34 family phosphoprotein [Nonomuraea sp. NEAU-A123]|uniref:GOLPH3/VPS74 family protein n=1 Tax=Nonomuraea sp. NEAU-A123 TaxID=2839649 RepID=UPI001BE40248|nr:GPP34 family phosphoprotein [Nonomuraea sp. NEAU-A123]MBT2234729.1 GPP34 family phosphoprotein [Nonomuraea sp. NEAU-A123]
MDWTPPATGGARGRTALLLADDLFFTMWDTTHAGLPYLHPSRATLGLAGALIGELVLRDRLTVEGEHLRVIDTRRVHENVADGALASIMASPRHTAVRTWLEYLAKNAVKNVTGRLIAARLLTREKPTLLGRERFRYTQFTKAMWPSTRLRLDLDERAPMTVQDMLLAALVDACDLMRVVIEDPADRPAAAAYLTALLKERMPQPLKDLVGGVRAVVGDSVLTYR